MMARTEAVKTLKRYCERCTHRYETRLPGQKMPLNRCKLDSADVTSGAGVPVVPGAAGAGGRVAAIVMGGATTCTDFQQGTKGSGR